MELERVEVELVVEWEVQPLSLGWGAVRVAEMASLRLSGQPSAIGRAPGAWGVEVLMVVEAGWVYRNPQATRANCPTSAKPVRRSSHPEQSVKIGRISVSPLSPSGPHASCD